MNTDRGPVPATTAPQVRRATPPGFADFFRANYRELVKAAMYTGAAEAEAEDAAAAAMEYMFVNWAEIKQPLAYGWVVTVRYYYKERTRGLGRLRERLIERHTPPTYEDRNLTAWEDRRFVVELLDSLPPGQRAVMACIVDGFKPSEIAELLGRSPAAIRQSLHDARQRLQRTLQAKHAADQRPAGFARKEGQ